MAIQQGIPYDFRTDLFKAIHDFDNDTFKIALYGSDAEISGTSTVVYTTTGEISGTGYTAGGKDLTGVSIQTTFQVATVSFDDVVWQSASFTARGALVYNSSKSNRAIAVIDFGTDKTCSSSFTVQMPPNTPTAALIRIQ